VVTPNGISWDEIKDLSNGHEVVPEGQWLGAFKKVFPNHDGGRPIGLADDSWRDHLDHPNFPVIRSADGVEFAVAIGSFSGVWRWLMKVGKPTQEIRPPLGWRDSLT